MTGAHRSVRGRIDRRRFRAKDLGVRTLLASLLVLGPSALAGGCTTSTCQPIPDGVYAAIAPDGAALTTPVVADAAADAGDAATDAGTDAAAVETAVTYSFHGGLPEPYDTWSCDKPQPSCEMAYVCTQGYQKVGLVTSFSPGYLAFSVTPPGSPGTIIQLRAP